MFTKRAPRPVTTDTPVVGLLVHLTYGDKTDWGHVTHVDMEGFTVAYVDTHLEYPYPSELWTDFTPWE